jgi:hypothetical protein
MESSAYATAGATFFLLAVVVVWLAFRLKLKNELLQEAICELHSIRKRTLVTQPTKLSLEPAPQPQSGYADAFLWKQTSEPSETEQVPVSARMLDESEFQRLLETETRFTGLVVLIGIEEDLRHSSEHERLMQSAQEYVVRLLGNNGLGCRCGHHEFLLICPGVRGEEAQRRLNEISERLWNFQLHGHGAFSVLFSWGGIGVDGEPLSAAIASAMDRLQQTKRNRKLYFMDSASPKRRQAV